MAVFIIVVLEIAAGSLAFVFRDDVVSSFLEVCPLRGSGASWVPVPDDCEKGASYFLEEVGDSGKCPPPLVALYGFRE